MRCKVGDLAVYVGRDVRDVGKIVTCVKFVWWDDGRPTWRIDPPLTESPGYNAAFAFDSSLRPIRDTPGADETLQWAPVPRVAEVV